MSRDLTPYELHMADKKHYQDTNQYLHDAKITLTDRNGIQTEIGCQKYKALYEVYPNLCFLLGADYVKSLAHLQKELQEVEHNLTELIARLDDTSEKVDLTNCLEKWYVGKLANRYYYCEENNELFVEYIRSLKKSS